MRILHTEWMGVKGGQAMRVLEDMHLARELGHTPLLAAKEENWLFQQAREEGFETFPLPFGHLADPKPYLAVLKLLQRERIDVVHTHSSKDSYPATYAAKVLGKKVVRSRHMALTKRPGHLFRIADAVVTTGETIRQELIDYGLDPSKVLSIPTYPDARRFVPDRERAEAFCRHLGIEEGQIVIGTLGGTGEMKRAWALVDMMQRFSSLPVVLLIAGPQPHDSRDKLEERIQKARLQDRVRILGYIDPLPFLDGIDIYACPSKSEGLPQALMQAMMMGKACVSTRVGSIAELDMKGNLLLSPPEDLELFAKHLESLLHSPGRMRDAGRLNRELALKHFTRDEMKERTRILYDALGVDKERG
ncbi:glycosyltransferase family 4 protein [Nitratifractor sp.]|uniref:glycosyltransferase family 4 protein n=1 Tax=Nitratifractor sp. TaxID=2268144 RepID=UPI0025D9E2BD|nr:glycosyltransferase family 4 protein [Nitratifractor sp.]